MSKPHKCPVCNATGKVFAQPESNFGTSTTWIYNGTKVCPACNGSCVVWEPSNNIQYPLAPNVSPVIPSDNDSKLLLEKK